MRGVETRTLSPDDAKRRGSGNAGILSHLVITVRERDAARLDKTIRG
jgi:hypothetical protein